MAAQGNPRAQMSVTMNDDGSFIKMGPFSEIPKASDMRKFPKLAKLGADVSAAIRIHYDQSYPVLARHDTVYDAGLEILNACPPRTWPHAVASAPAEAKEHAVIAKAWEKSGFVGAVFIDFVSLAALAFAIDSACRFIIATRDPRTTGTPKRNVDLLARFVALDDMAMLAEFVRQMGLWAYDYEEVRRMTHAHGIMIMAEQTISALSPYKTTTDKIDFGLDFLKCIRDLNADLPQLEVHAAAVALSRSKIGEFYNASGQRYPPGLKPWEPLASAQWVQPDGDERAGGARSSSSSSSSSPPAPPHLRVTVNSSEPARPSLSQVFGSSAADEPPTHAPGMDDSD